mgnify:CR=1 FL=1
MWARALPRVGLAEQLVELGPAVDAAGLEVAPAAVVRDGVPGIALARDLGHGARGILERVVVADAEPARFAVARARQQAGGAAAHFGGAAQEARGARRMAGIDRELDRGIDPALVAGPQAARAVDGKVVAKIVVAARHSFSPRPLAFLSSSASGTGPGVK